MTNMSKNKIEVREIKRLTGKFWFINCIMLLIIVTYIFITLYELVTGNRFYGEKSWYEGSAFQMAFLGSVIGFIGEAKMILNRNLALTLETDQQIKALMAVNKTAKGINLFSGKGD